MKKYISILLSVTLILTTMLAGCTKSIEGETCIMNGVASILVVDDNPKFLADALPMYGYDVTVANDGLEALKILMNKSFDLILSFQ